MSNQSKRILGFLIAAETLFLGATFGTWVPVVIFAVFAALTIVHRSRHRPEDDDAAQRFPQWIRSCFAILFYLGIFVLVTAWRMPRVWDDAVNPIFVAAEILAHACLFWGLAVWAFRPHRAHVAMLPMGMVVVFLCVAAGGASRSAAAQATVGLATCLGFAAASQIILGTARGTGGELFVRQPKHGIPAGDDRIRWLGPLLSGLTLSVLLMGTSAVASTINAVLPDIQQALHQQLRDSLDAVTEELSFGGTRYVRGSKLGAMRKHMLSDPKAIALRVDCEVTPGYLRGHAFDLYRKRRWFSAGGIKHQHADALEMIQDRSIKPTRAGTAALKYKLSRPLSHFPLVPAPDETTIPMEVHTIPMNGSMVFVPLNTRWVEARGRSLVVTQHHTIRSGVDPNLPYIAGVGLRSLSEELSDAHRTILLDIPPKVKNAVNDLVAEAMDPQATPRQNADALAAHFQAKFSYSMKLVRPPSKVDPIEHFLELRHPAHCEYFASATVLALRAGGIPSRYVTGYIADEIDAEQSGDLESWLARNGDAHAWAEAYDDESKTWFAVESTPGRQYKTVEPKHDEQEGGSIFDFFSSDGPDQADSMVGRFIGWILSVRATDPLLLLFRLVQLPLFCVLVFVLWTKYFRPARDGLDPIDQQSRKMLRRVDRMARRRSFVRRPSETLYQFASRIEEQPQREEQESTRLARWYRQYADARYRGLMPESLART